MSYIGNTSTTQAFTPAIDYFSGNGSTVAFTLSRTVASVAQVQVTVNNVAQNPSTAITFPVQMRTTPTVNKNGTWTVSNCGQPSVSGTDINGFFLVASGSGAGNAAFNPSGSTTYLDTSGAEL